MKHTKVDGVNISENINGEPYDSETQRVKLLYSTLLLDSNPDDPIYNRYTSLAKRIFKVPTAFISLVDIGRTWFKSRSGYESLELPRIDSFCTHTILSENNDVLVINDTLHDSRFCNIPIVRGPPYVRFYAGAPIIVNFINIGTISIFDINPKYDFNNDEKLILQDISEAISYIITSRLQTILQLNNELSIENNRLTVSNEKDTLKKLKSFLMHNIRTPLMSIGLSSNLLESNFQLMANELNLINPSAVQVFDDTIIDLKIATKNLENIVSSTLYWNNKDTTINTITDGSYHSDNSLDKSYTICNILDILRIIRLECFQLITSHQKNINLQWFLIDDMILLEGLHSSFPEILTIILQTLHEQLLIIWENISVYIYYIENNISEVSLFPLHSYLSTSENYRWHTSIFGQLLIEIKVSNPVSNNSNSSQYPMNLTPISNASINDFNITPNNMTDINNNFDHHETKEKNELPKNDNIIKFHRKLEFINNLLLEIKGSTPLTTKSTTNTTTTPSFPSTINPRNDVAAVDEIIQENNINNNNNNNNKVFTFAIPCNIINRRKVDDVTTSSDNSFDQLPFLNQDKKISKRSSNTSSNDSHGNSITIAQDIEESSDESSTTSSSSSFSLGRHNTNNNRPFSLLLPPPSIVMIPSPEVSSDYLFNNSGDKILKVLIIEDSKLIQRVLQRWLQAKHCVVTLADNGSAGLTLLTSRKFDITITDFVMPILSGSDTLRLYKEWRKNYAKNGNEWNSDMLIIGMSANATVRHQNTGFHYGMHIYTPKPIDLEIMTTVLELRREHREISSLMTCIRSQTNLRTCFDTTSADIVDTNASLATNTAIANTPSGNTFSYFNKSNHSVESLSEISLSEWSTSSVAASATGHFNHRRITKKPFRSILPEPFTDDAPSSNSGNDISPTTNFNRIAEEKSSDGNGGGDGDGKYDTPFSLPVTEKEKAKNKEEGRGSLNHLMRRVARVRSNSVTMLALSLQRTTSRFPRIGCLTPPRPLPPPPTTASSSTPDTTSCCFCFFWSRSSSVKIDTVT